MSRIVTPEDGVVVCRAGNLHRFWVDVEGEDGDGEQEDVVLLLNATDSGKDFVLDRVFFENWYGMRYDSLTYGEGIDLVQMLCVSVDLIFFFFFGSVANVLSSFRYLLLSLIHRTVHLLAVIIDFRCRRSLHSYSSRTSLVRATLDVRLHPDVPWLLDNGHHWAVYRQPARIPSIFPGIHDRLGVSPGKSKAYVVSPT